VVLVAESLLVTSYGIKWYWLEHGLSTSSQNGLRLLNELFKTSPESRLGGVINSALYLQFRVRNFVLQDSEISCRRVSYG
jgi:hypothetical protein